MVEKATKKKMRAVLHPSSITSIDEEPLRVKYIHGVYIISTSTEYIPTYYSFAVNHIFMKLIIQFFFVWTVREVLDQLLSIFLLCVFMELFSIMLFLEDENTSFLHTVCVTYILMYRVYSCFIKSLKIF